MKSSALREYLTAAPGQPTLVCCPHAGGAASFFASWRMHLPTGWGLAALRYPAREDRLSHPMPPALEHLAEAAADELAARDDLLVLFGHSMGASVAYELALRLAAVGRPPGLLAVSARAPSHRISHLDGGMPQTDDELVAHLRRLSSSMSAFLDEPELRQLVMPAVRADYELVRGYGPTAPRRVASGILALSGASDAGAPAAVMAGWADLCEGGFAARDLPGDHFYLVGQEVAVIGAIAARLAAGQPV